MQIGSKKILAVDVDDVLVHICTPWVALAKAHGPTSAYIPDRFNAALLGRRQPYIQQWMRDDLGMPQELLPQVDSLYRDNATFYDDLPPTQFCTGVMRALALPGRVSHVHVITHNFSNGDASAASKERWLRTHLGGPERVTIHNVEVGQSKSDVMQRHCPEPHAFADDSLKNVADVLLNDKVRPHEILIPRMGHNALTRDMVELAFLRRIAVNYYEKVL